MMARALAALAVTLLLAAPAYAQDEPPPPATGLPGASPAAAPAPAPAAAPVAADAFKKFAAKGVIEIEGGIGFGYQKGGDYNFTLSPAGRYFIIKGLSVGLKLDISYYKFGDGNLTTVGLIPMAEYNLDLGGRLYPYGGLGLGYGYNKVGGDNGYSYNSGILDIGVGVKMVFGHGGILGLGIQFPVSFYKPDVPGAETETSWAFQILTRYGIYF